MHPGWTDALRLTRSVLPHQGLTAINERLAVAAARPVIVPETIVCARGEAYPHHVVRGRQEVIGPQVAVTGLKHLWASTSCPTIRSQRPAPTGS
jgi:hypothetical protein